jgi:hypothetical protein
VEITFSLCGSLVGDLFEWARLQLASRWSSLALIFANCRFFASGTFITATLEATAMEIGAQNIYMKLVADDGRPLDAQAILLSEVIVTALLCSLCLYLSLSLSLLFSHL